MTSKNEHQDWAQRIAALMEAADVTVDDLSRQLKIGRSTAYAWCKGTRIPSRPMQPKLARVLRVSIAQLNGWAA
jgi:transcriptional regulator with XRE-family HTH domain